LFEIIRKEVIAPKTVKFYIKAPNIVKSIQPGQFVMIKTDEKGERIPLSISGWNYEEGTLRIIIQGVGKTSNDIILMKEGDFIESVVGPLGVPTHMGNYGNCVVIGGGYGTGAVIPIAEKLKKLGNNVFGIVGARNKDLLIMANELKEAVNHFYITTNDGSEGIKGFVTDALTEIMKNHEIHWVISIGPVPMMKAVANMTKDKNIPTFASLNAIMVDGTGMCGACRVTVGGETKFACIHGPDFDAHKVNFEELVLRQSAYKELEEVANESYKTYDFSNL